MGFLAQPALKPISITGELKAIYNTAGDWAFSLSLPYRYWVLLRATPGQQFLLPGGNYGGGATTGARAFSLSLPYRYRALLRVWSQY